MLFSIWTGLCWTRRRILEMRRITPLGTVVIRRGRWMISTSWWGEEYTTFSVGPCFHEGCPMRNFSRDIHPWTRESWTKWLPSSFHIMTSTNAITPCLIREYATCSMPWKRTGSHSALPRTNIRRPPKKWCCIISESTSSSRFSARGRGSLSSPTLR